MKLRVEIFSPGDPSLDADRGCDWRESIVAADAQRFGSEQGSWCANESARLGDEFSGQDDCRCVETPLHTTLHTTAVKVDTYNLTQGLGNGECTGLTLILTF